IRAAWVCYFAGLVKNPYLYLSLAESATHQQSNSKPMYTLSNDFKAYIRRPETRKLTAAPVLEVVDLMCEKSTTNKDVEQACARHRERDAVRLKLESLDFLLGYAGYILEDGVITSGEAYDFAALKRVFSIQEGDFLQFRNF